MILELIEKIFMILMGILVVVILFGIFSNLNKQSCEPAELYSHEEVTGFGGGVFDNMFDTVCSSILDINSGLWGAYTSTAASFSGLRPVLSSISNGIWGLGKIFCKTRTNSDFVERAGRSAISDPEVLKELLLYEAERCWNIFEGKNLGGLSDSDRNPIANIKHFECAEIIYDLPPGEYLSLKDIYESIYLKNSCGEERNIPKNPRQAFNDEYNSSKGEIQWCVQKELLEDYWFNKFAQAGSYNGIECEYNDKSSTDSSACLSTTNAMCSLGKINGYEEDDDVLVINGFGRIAIYYYDWWKLDYEHRSDKLNASITLAQGLIDFKRYSASKIDFPQEYVEHWHGDENYIPNQLFIYYEKYDLPDEKCFGTLDCSKPYDSGLRECEYSLGCHRPWLGDCVPHEIYQGASCNVFATKAKCESNNFAGCEWGTAGQCKFASQFPQGQGGTVGAYCANFCGTNWFGASDCSRSTFCKENINWLTMSCTAEDEYSSGNPANMCNSLNSKYLCEKNSCFGCYWELCPEGGCA
ncbi:MAG: hypothetical protein PHT91_02935 [Candidatus Nanoarchaeia archaeon]|nr:hypothetical protein [Candidatus Nanoarchaeia archaeon]